MGGVFTQGRARTPGEGGDSPCGGCSWLRGDPFTRQELNETDRLRVVVGELWNVPWEKAVGSAEMPFFPKFLVFRMIFI